VARPSDPGDVGGEEVDAVAVQVSAGAVVVLGGAWVRLAREDLRIAEWNAGVEGVGDRRVPQRVRLIAQSQSGGVSNGSPQLDAGSPGRAAGGCAPAYR